MVPLGVVVSRVLVDEPSEMSLAKRDRSAQAFLSDGSHEALGVGVGLFGGSFRGSTPEDCKSRRNSWVKERVSVVNQEPGASQEPPCLDRCVLSRSGEQQVSDAQN